MGGWGSLGAPKKKPNPGGELWYDIQIVMTSEDRLQEVTPAGRSRPPDVRHPHCGPRAGLLLETSHQGRRPRERQ